uniref:Signal peptidase complex subunit 1 n=1 Tax=Romanomermis culicivorax TaxID=13658 RepID=A0A915KI23_ROMCU
MLDIDLDALIKKLPFATHFDFEGQRKAEKFFQIVIVIAGVIGFLIGYVAQQFSYTVFTVIGAFALCCLVVLPPWPCFHKNPLQWQKALPSSSEVGSKSSNNKNKKKK